MVLTPANLEWRDGQPFSRQFGDIYFSAEDGLAETRYVFLDSSRLPERLSALSHGDSFTIAETGFGTGLNFLAAWQLWRQVKPEGAWLHMVSAELHPLTPADLSKTLALWPELADLSATFLQQYPPLTPGWHRLVFEKERLTLTLLFGDARILLPDLSARVDAWLLDGFAPDRNPELWQLELLKDVGRLSKPGASIASFTCAGVVRRALTESGFQVRKQKGYGRKREMIVATKTENPPVHDAWHDRPAAHSGERHAMIIGAGIAGISIARALAQRGWDIDLVDQAEGPGAAASGNPAAIICPKIGPGHLSPWLFHQQAYLWLLSQVRSLPDAWRETGLLWLLAGNQARDDSKISGHPWDDHLMHRLDAAEASQVAGVPLNVDCLYFPHAGFLLPQILFRHWLSSSLIRCHWRQRVTTLQQSPDGWSALDADGQVIVKAPVVILANALAAKQFPECAGLPLYPVRGQISRFPTNPGLSHLKSVLSYGGYVTPAFDGEHCMGASFIPDDDSTQVTMADHQHNRQLLKTFVPGLDTDIPDISDWTGRASFRTQTHDYLPIAGPMPVLQERGHPPGENRFHRGLYTSLGYGSKGFYLAPLVAEILAADLNGEPYPVPERVLRSLHPGRFRARESRRHPDGNIPRHL